MSCFSKQILDYFYNIQNTGRILKPEAIGRAGSKQEGTVIEFSWRVKDEVIIDARFRTFGDVNAIAISSVLTSMMIGKTISDVLSITAEDILEHLKDNKPNYLYLTDLALSALANTYENYIKKFTKANPELAKTSEFAETLRENLAKIQKGEEIDNETNYDLSNINSFEEKDDEDSYLRNLTNYEKTVEENSIAKSLNNLLYGYSVIDNGEIKETKFENNVIEKTTKVGRGRPKKERTIEELEAENNKIVRGRGRPKKERTTEEIEAEKNKVVRGRGRPKKERTEEEIQEELSNVKRGRGRPKKEVSLEETSENKISRGRGRPKKERTIEELEAENNKIIRGRGRPKKERTPEEIEAEKNKVVRGRGRPKKERTEEEIQEELSKVKRGRGRPKKINTNSETNLEFETDNSNIFTATNNNFDDNFTSVNNISNDSVIDLEPVDISKNIETKNNELHADLAGDELTVKRGRGRPKKERTAEEEEAESNKVVRGRGRPKKERTPEEIEAEKNKVVRGRGRPRKDDNSVFGIVSLREGNNDSAIVSNLVNVKNNFETDLVERTTRGRGRPKKERTEEEIEAENNKVIRGRGRPKKERTEEESQEDVDSTKRGRGRPKKDSGSETYDDETVNAVEAKLEFEQQDENNNLTNLSITEQNDKLPENVSQNPVEVESFKNDFAPQQNKYGVGIKSTNYFSTQTKKITTETTKIETNLDRYTGSVIRKYNLDEEKTTNLSHYEDNANDDSVSEPLSENVSNILKNGGSIEEALKALLDDND